MCRRPPKSKPTDTLYPHPPLFRSHGLLGLNGFLQRRHGLGRLLVRVIEFGKRNDDLGIIRIGGGQRLELGESARIILALKAERREEIGRASCRERVCQYV